MNAQHHPSPGEAASHDPDHPPDHIDLTHRDPKPAGVTGTPGGHSPGARSPRPSIRRSKSDQVLGGVCGGLGAAAGIDPVWFRLGFIFLALSSGVGLLLYLIAWIIIPEADDSDPPASDHRTETGAVVFGIFLLVIGSALLADAIIPWFDRIVWPLALIGVGIGMIYFSATRRYGS